jgi:hypothetical protein
MDSIIEEHKDVTIEVPVMGITGNCDKDVEEETDGSNIIPI